MAGKRQQQLTLSSFFKKLDSPHDSQTSETLPTASSPAVVSATRSSLAETHGDDRDRTTTTTTTALPSTAEKKRHSQFVEKFGNLEIERTIKRARVNTLPATSTVDSDATPSQAMDVDAPLLTPLQAKYSPLELQVVELQKRYPGVLLVVEVGYKFRFFGQDAKVASRILHIAHYMDRNFLTASIPVHRLNIHVRRLVHAGYKVGVVRQTETAALKALGANKSAPFVRELKQLYTKGTFVDEMVSAEAEDDARTGSMSNYLMCVVEEKRGGTGSDELVHTGIVAVQPATGDIVYDAFDDGFMRSELETRMLHVEPCELLLSHNLSKTTQKLVNTMSLQRTTSAMSDAVRVEWMPDDDTFYSDYNTALTYVSDFYSQRQTSGASEDALFANVLQLPPVTIKALAATLRYLSEFGLEHALQLTKYFVHFSSRSHMLLNGNTLANLEIYRNSTNHTTKGSLFWILNHTRTNFGKRLLRSWVGRPLVDTAQLEIRIDAVNELLVTDNPKKAKTQELLKQLPDLEKGLCRIHYGKSSPLELVQVLDALLKVANAFYGTERSFLFESPLLNSIFASLPGIRDSVLQFRELIDASMIEKQDCKLHMFKTEERWPDLPRLKNDIALVEEQLEEYLKTVHQTVAIPSLKYVHVSGIEYLLEVKNTLIPKVPKEWIKINGTKAASRFHTPYILGKLREREQHKERLVISSEAAYKDMLRSVSEKYEVFRDVVLRLAQLDCLLSLGVVAARTNYVKPTFTEHSQLSVVNGRHPMVDQFLGPSYVPNNVDFDAMGHRTMILTGPNMGGKSSYIRQVALIAIMGQIGSYVPAESAKLGIFDAIFTRMGALDNMLAGESTFMVELHETADIMKQATERSLVILDELGRGTSTHDGMAIAYAVLRHFITEVRCITLFVTHYPSLSELAHEFADVAVNGHMSFIEEHQGDMSAIVFLYKLARGVATRSYGLNVARLAALPSRVLAVAKTKAREMEESVTQRSNVHRLREMVSKRRVWK